jgi:CHAD domain-containing protein
VRILNGSATVRDVVGATLAGAVERLIRHDPGVRLGSDPEDVHRARVATRRLRSNLRTFRAYVDPDWASALRRELGWFATDLGAVRDAEVMMLRLRDRVEALPETDRRSGTALVDRLVAVRDHARETALATMRGDRYVGLLERLVAAARDPVVVGAAEAPAEALAQTMERPWERLRSAIAAIEDVASDAGMHAARIRAKRVRYAAEAVQPVFGKDAKAFVKAATELQDVLGEHQDAVVLEGWLREAAAGGRARTAFVAGELAAGERRAAMVASASWADAWRALSRKRLEFWT